MTPDSSITDSTFRRILARNIAVPLATGIINALLFAALIFYLLSVFRWVEHSEQVIGKSFEISKLTIDMQTGLRGYLITGDEEFLAPRKAARAVIADELGSLQALLGDSAEQSGRVDRVRALLDEWDEYAETVIGMRRNNEDFTSLVRVNGLSFDGVRRELAEFQNVERNMLHQRSERASFITVIAVLAYLSISLLLTGILTYFSRRELVQLSDAYNASLTGMQASTRQLELQTWQRTGQADLAAKCVGQVALPVLGRTILDFLGEYLDSPVATMYVQDSKGGTLQRIAGFGASQDSFARGKEPSVANKQPSAAGGQSSASGEAQGLVEQAAWSNRLLHLENVPDHYLQIQSGLGATAPTNIVLLPIRHDGEPNGVVELGFLKPPAPHVLDFLNMVSTSIGSTVEMALNRRRLQDTLEESQQLNEELLQQQEELRSANEELEEQSRVLEESQAQLENQKAELEQNNERLTEQTEMLDRKNTELNAAQMALEERARDLQRASKYKSEFLANMSHELRTPLNSSMILAKLLAENQKGNLNDEQIQFAQSIYSSGNDLLNLINDILDISKVEAGKLELDYAAVAVNELVDSLQLTFEPLASQKGLKLNVSSDLAKSRMLETDRQRLEQILKNLLSNAVKFTETGEVTLQVTERAYEDSQSNSDAAFMEFRVKDTGIGIAADQQKVIFEAFQQADGGISRRFGGTGLGLSISRDLAALLGGSISVESQPGQGSTFILCMPCQSPHQVQSDSSIMTPVSEHAPALASHVATPATPAMTTPKPAARPVQPAIALTDDRDTYSGEDRAVLVIEDDREFARILYNLAREQKYQCLIALNASEGLQLAIEYIPDAILLDIGLPDMSGLAVLQKLKSSALTRHIPVHIVSGADRTEAALQLGAVGYVTKPTSRERLQAVFQTIEGKLSQKMKHVLLVEDDAKQRQAVIHLIADADVEITAVERGAEALELLRTTIFDCMIIDLKLPDMQGHELLQRMSSEELCCFPPVIVYTGRNLTRDEENELLKYSRSIIIKGARSPERLLDEVTLFLHKVESELSTDRQKMLKTVRSRDRVLEARKILLVDDDMRNLFALTGALELKGAVVEIARNGHEALRKLEEVSDIDLILMDIMMPGMDGLEATRRIRADSRFKKIPIIAVTAKAMKDDQEQCLKAGASDYMAKPIDIDRLYSLLRVWMPSLERLT